MNFSIDNKSFSKNTILSTSSNGEFQENKHRYFVDVMRDISSGSVVYQGTIELNVDDASIYSKGDKVFLNVIGVGYPIQDYLKGYYEISFVNYADDKITLKDNGSFASSGIPLTPLNYEVGKADRLSFIADRFGEARIELDKVFVNYLNSRFDYSQSSAHLVERFTKEFKIVYGESYVKDVRFDIVTSVNGLVNFNVFTDVAQTPIYLLQFLFKPDDYVIVSGASKPFYNGVQQVFSVDSLDLVSRKPYKFGIDFSSSIKIKRADNKTFDFYEGSTTKIAINSGFNKQELKGKTEAELLTKEQKFTSVSNNKAFLTYAPRNQKTTINDEGYLYYYYDSASDGSDLIVRYNVDGVVNSYTLNTSESGVYAIPSNPKSINKNGNDWIDCNAKSYQVSVNNSEVFTYNLINAKRFNSARLIWNDKLGSYQGLTFTCKNKVEVKRNSTTFESDAFDFNSNIRLKNLARGTQELNSESLNEYTLQSDYVTEEVGVFLETLMTSDDVMMQYDGGDLFSVVLSSDSIEINEKADGLIQYSIKVKSAIYED